MATVAAVGAIQVLNWAMTPRALAQSAGFGDGPMSEFNTPVEGRTSPANQDGEDAPSPQTPSHRKGFLNPVDARCDTMGGALHGGVGLQPYYVAPRAALQDLCDQLQTETKGHDQPRQWPPSVTRRKHPDKSHSLNGVLNLE